MAASLDLRPPELSIHGIAGRELAQNITITGGVLTSPTMTTKTAGGDSFTTDPGVGSSSMPEAYTLRLVWTAADMAVLNTTTRPKTYRIEVAGSVDGNSATSVLGGTFTVYPTTWARPIPQTTATLTLNNGAAVTLAITVPPPTDPIDGGLADWVADSIDGGTHDSIFTDTTYDGGSI